MQSAKPFHVHLFWDPALDVDKSDVRQYLNTRDPKQLQPIGGQKLQTFVCRPIVNDATIDRLERLPLADAQKLAFRVSVFQVRDAIILDGSKVASLQPRAVTEREKDCDDVTDEKGRVARMPPLELDELWDPSEVSALFDRTTQREVGEVIRARCFLPPGIAQPYVLPPSSQRLLRLSGRLFAAVEPEGAQRIREVLVSLQKTQGASEELGAAAAVDRMLESPLERASFVSSATGE